MKLVIVSASLFGTKQKYTSGTLKMAKHIDDLNKSKKHSFQCQFRVNYDNSVPDDVIYHLQNIRSVELVDMSMQSIYRKETRKMWSFLPFDSHDICIVIDVGDPNQSIQTLQHMISRLPDFLAMKTPRIYGKKAHSTYNGTPLAFTGGTIMTVFLNRLEPAINIKQMSTDFLIKEGKMIDVREVGAYPTLQRFQHGYGLDELFISSLVQNLSKHVVIDILQNIPTTNRPTRSCVTKTNQLISECYMKWSYPEDTYDTRETCVDSDDDLSLLLSQGVVPITNNRLDISAITRWWKTQKNNSITRKKRDSLKGGRISYNLDVAKTPISLWTQLINSRLREIICKYFQSTHLICNAEIIVCPPFCSEQQIHRDHTMGPRKIVTLVLAFDNSLVRTKFRQGSHLSTIIPTDLTTFQVNTVMFDGFIEHAGSSNISSEPEDDRLFINIWNPRFIKEIDSHFDDEGTSNRRSKIILPA